MSHLVKILLMLSFFLLGAIRGNAQCVHLNGSFYDNQGRKLTKKQLRKVRADAPLINAIETGDMAALKSALKNGVDVNARDCESGTTALILTVMNSNPEMMRTLIEHKANVNLQNNSGFTALMYAVGWGQIGIVKELIAAGADVNAKRKNRNGGTALSMALAYSNNKEMQEIVKILRDNGATR